MPSEKQNGTALQILLTILVAVLLGSTGWLAQATITNMGDVVRLKTQFEERGEAVKEMEKELKHVAETQQEVLRTLVKMSDEDQRLSNRVTTIEKNQSQ